MSPIWTTGYRDSLWLQLRHGAIDSGEAPFAVGESAAVGREALAALDGAIGTLDEQIDTPRRARAATHLLAEEAMEVVLNAIFTPGGEMPAEDVVADVIARGFDRNLVQNVGVALGEIGPDDLRTMREPLRAKVLTSKLKSIAAQCGRHIAER